jgi:hypothetical protein
MEPHQKTIHPCPFCQKETLEVLTWPAHTAVRSGRSAAAKSTTYVKQPEGFELLSEKSLNCGKSAKEIKKTWKEGMVEHNTEKQKKRLEDLKGLGFSGVLNN